MNFIAQVLAVAIGLLLFAGLAKMIAVHFFGFPADANWI